MTVHIMHIAVHRWCARRTRIEPELAGRSAAAGLMFYCLRRYYCGRVCGSCNFLLCAICYCFLSYLNLATAHAVTGGTNRGRGEG